MANTVNAAGSEIRKKWFESESLKVEAKMFVSQVGGKGTLELKSFHERIGITWESPPDCSYGGGEDTDMQNAQSDLIFIPLLKKRVNQMH